MIKLFRMVRCRTQKNSFFFYVNGTVHHNSMSKVQQDATIHSLFYL